VTDLDRALGAALAFGEKMLAKKGAFTPFAAVVDHDGIAIAQVPKVPRGGDPDAALETLVDGLRDQRGRLWAVALATNRTDAELGDVLHVHVEQRQGGLCAVVLVPYTARRRGRAVTFEEPRRVPSTSIIWPSSS
jgi:hypothetical protein